MKTVHVAIVVALALLVAGCGADEPEVGLAGIVRSPAPVVGDVTLPNQTDGANTPFSFTAREGSLLIVYFGYTGCPDVCPTTMADLRKAVRELDETAAEAIDVALVSVDPERDTAQVLTSYVHAFFPDGYAIRTDDPAALEMAAGAFGVQYSVEKDDEGNVEVEHSAFLYAVDDTGRLLLSWPFGIEADMIANDLRLLLEEATA